MATVKKIKKAQVGDRLVKKKSTSSGSMYKYKSDDGDYTTKIKYRAGEEPSPENPEFRGTVTKRRTIKGLLSGAPKPNMKSGGKVTKAKAGKEMIKRADGSYSQRGLWDNLRAAKGSGKKPTAAMLKQERKIKSQSKKK